MIESIEEPIEVLGLFRGGVVQPLRFRWKNRVVRVSKVTGDWSVNDGRDRIHFFSVLGDNSDYYELSYHTRKLTWELSRVWLAG
jgi:hypothetical protein